MADEQTQPGQTNGTPGNGSDQGQVTPGQTPDGDAADDAPQYLTKADLDGILDSLAGVIDRQVQSRVDKLGGSYQKRFDALQAQNAQFMEAAKAAGLPEAQQAQLAKHLSETAYQKALTGNGNGDKREPPGEEPAGNDLDEITRNGMFLAQRLGLAPNDPELKLIKTKATGAKTEDDYYASIEAAAQAKRERAAKAAAPANPGRMPGHAPSGTNAKRDLSRTSIREDMAEALKKDKRFGA